MTTREKLIQAVLDLPDSELEPVAEILASRGKPGEKAGDIIDGWGNLSAMTRAGASGMLGRLDEEEIAEFGETIAEAWGYESPK